MPKKESIKPPDMPTAPFFMGTYGDMVTLLFALFVILYSMSDMDPKLFENASKAMKGAFGILPAQESPMKSTAIKITDIDVTRRMSEYESMLDMEQVIKELDMVDKITVQQTEAGAIIRFTDEVLFRKGSALLRPEAFDVLRAVGVKLQEKNPKSIEVEGHTDSTPIRSRQFPSNWELSSARATSVVKFFINIVEIDPSKLQATGHGEYKPIAPNNNRINMAKNRRVEIIVTDRSFKTNILK